MVKIFEMSDIKTNNVSMIKLLKFSFIKKFLCYFKGISSNRAYPIRVYAYADSMRNVRFELVCVINAEFACISYKIFPKLFQNIKGQNNLYILKLLASIIAKVKYILPFIGLESFHKNTVLILFGSGIAKNVYYAPIDVFQRGWGGGATLGIRPTKIHFSREFCRTF